MTYTTRASPSGPLVSLQGPVPYYDFTPTESTSVPREPGRVFYDPENDCLSFYTINPDVTISISQEVTVTCVNKTGVVIPDGAAVYINDAQGNRPTIALAIATGIPQGWAVGLATHDIANNAEGAVTLIGVVHGYDTRPFNDGDYLFVSDTVPGGLQNTRPTGTSIVWFVGIALNTTVNGSIAVKPNSPALLAHLNDVDDGDPTTAGRLLVANGTHWTSATALHLEGTGSPEGAVAAPLGSTYRNLLGGAGTTFYVKESGSAGNTGWVAK